MGDFNIHIDDAVEQPDTQTFLDLLDSLGLKQHVTQPTHVSGHILDLIITRNSENIIKYPPSVDRFIPDHASIHSIMCTLEQSNPASIVMTRRYRKIKSVNVETYRTGPSYLCVM